MNKLTHLSLFSGIGGLDLSAEWAGFKTVGQCECSEYPTKVLEKHWPDVPRWKDIKTLTGDSFYEQTGLQTVDLVSGGFPCQPFSVSGKHRGKEDDRYLWPEMFRIIKELRPTWVVGENVTGIVNMALDTVLSNLEDEEYSCASFIIPACSVNAPHKRNRVAIVAYYDGRRCGEKRKFKSVDGVREEKKNHSLQTEKFCSYNFKSGANWDIEPRVDRVVHGISNQVDRLKCLGNAVVPQQFYPIFKAIADIEDSYE